MAEPYIELIVLGLSADKIFDLFYGLEYSDFARSSIDPLIYLHISPEFHEMSISHSLAGAFSDDEFGSLVTILFIDSPDGTIVRFVPAYDVFVDDAIAELIFRILEKLFQWTRVKMVNTSLDSWDYFDEFDPRTLDDILKVKPKFTEPPDEKKTSNENKEKYPWDQIPDYNWDRTAVEMLWRNYTNKEIASLISTTEGTVRTRLSELRAQESTKEFVPLRSILKQRGYYERKLPKRYQKR